MKVTIQVAILLCMCSVAALAADPKPQDYPLKILIMSAQQEPYSVQGGGSTNCQDYGGTINCTTSNSSWNHAATKMLVRIRDGEITRDYVVGCDAAFRWSKCKPLETGEYSARWKGKGLDILFTNKGKLQSHEYIVFGSSIVAPAAPPRETASPAPAAREDERATLTVSSDPANADIYLDGDFVGNAPSTVKVAPGKHTIKCSARGFKDWSRELNVLGGSSINVTANLEKN